MLCVVTHLLVYSLPGSTGCCVRDIPNRKVAERPLVAMRSIVEGCFSSFFFLISIYQLLQMLIILSCR